MATLGEVISLAKNEFCGDRTFPVLSITMKDGIVFQGDKFKKQIASADTSGYKVVHRGQLVQGIHIDEANFGIQNLTDAGIVSPAYKIWNIDTTKVLPQYVAIVLRSPSSIRFYQSKLNGSVIRRGHMSDKDFLGIPFPLVSFSEQQHILSVLDKVSNLMTCCKQQLADLDLLVKSRFVEMFEGKYHSISIGDVFKTTSGGTPSKSHPEYYEGGTIPWLSSGEVNAGIIETVKSFITEEGMNNSSAKMVPENCVVVAMYGATAGQVGLLHIATTTNQAVCSILPNEKYIPEYLYYAVKSRKDWMISQCAGGAQPNISQGVIKRMQIIDAPYEMQKQFAEFMQQADKSKFAVQQTLSNLETL